MSDEENFAPGPVDANAHTSDEVPAEQRSSADPRASRIEAERNGQPPVVPNVPSQNPDELFPVESVIFQELSEIRAQLDMTATAVLTGIWLMGMIVGYGAFTYYKNRPLTVEAQEVSVDE